MLKKRKYERFPNFQFPRCYVRSLRVTCFDFLYFSFLIIWTDLKELLLVLLIFVPQQKKQAIKQKRFNLMIESLLSNNTSNRFEFIVTSPSGKNLWPPTQWGNHDSYLQENQGLSAECSCNFCHVSLKSG